MKRASLKLCGMAAVCLLAASLCLARGGAGGFRGGAHPGGFQGAPAHAGGFQGGVHPGGFQGGVNPAAGAYQRSPSMSRAAPGPVAAARPSPAAQRPTPGQLGQFLNMPQGSEIHTIDGKHGGSITYGHGSGSKTTPSGATIEGAGAGAVIEGPRGGTHVVGVGGVEASKGDRSAAAAGSIRGTETPGGVTAGRARGVGEISGPRGTIAGGGSIAGIKGPEGAAAFHAQRGVVARGPNGRVAIGARQVTAVRGNFTGYRWYWTPAWYARYPRAWFVPGIAVAAWWAAPAWNYAYGWYGTTGQPVVYDYGTNVVYEGDTVYYGEQPVATADQYYEQAGQIAGTGVADTENQEWLPLGVFAVVSEGQTKTDKILQLAVNKEGILRGNLHDTISDTVVPIAGAVDKQTQRAAFRAAAGTSPVVAECGLWNLTQDSLPVLVHFDKDRAETRTLIRLTEPEPQTEGK